MDTRSQFSIQVLKVVVSAGDSGSGVQLRIIDPLDLSET